MKNRDTFSSYHPINNFVYFALVLVCTMCFVNPVCLLISLFSSQAYNINLLGQKAVRKYYVFMIPLMLLAAFVNPIFNHEGVTILTYIPTGNPLTLESIVYGVFAAVMIMTVLSWFNCYNEIMTSDKFVYLFGRIIPALSLIISMALRFVPKFKDQAKKVSDGQKMLGRDISEGSVINRIKTAATIMSILITWSLENAIESADSMRSRGYGLPGRTAFSIYRFDKRDKMMLLWLCFCGMFILSGSILEVFYFRYYPSIKWAQITPFTICFYFSYLAMCITPVYVNYKEDRLWKHIQSET